MNAPTPARRYRFAPRDRTGVLFGLNLVQCLVLGVGIFTAGLLLQAGVPMLTLPVPILSAAVLAFARWDDKSCAEHLATAYGSLLARLLDVTEWRATANNELPPFLQGLQVDEVSAPSWVPRFDDGGIAMVVDARDNSISATIPVRGRRFSLCEGAEQDRLLGGWGSAISTFASEGSAVKRISWGERAAKSPDPLDVAISPSSSPATRSYLQLVRDEAQSEMRHEATVTITVDLTKVRGGGHEDRLSAGRRTLCEELRLLTVRLQDADLDVDAPLSAEELHYAIHARLDPEPGEITTGRTLAQLAGLAPARTGPRTAALERNWVRVDQSVHHTYVISEWPRSDVEATWMEALLLHSGATRTISLFAEPVPPSQSRRRIERQTIKLATDAEQRADAGFRVGAEHQRSSDAVAEREAELLAGHVEFTYVGLLTVTAPDGDTLRESCLDYEQRASQCGLQLQSLDAAHDLGLACALPLGRSPRPQRYAS